VLVLGLTYRAGVNETRASPGVDVARRLADRARDVYVCDPVCTDVPLADVRSVGVDEFEDVDVDAVVLTTPHEAFEAIDWASFEDVVVVDGHRLFDADTVGHPYYAVGVGSE
jgi:UDP-N-acetyl-D-mannosaminuronic acid dehydrogenase